MTAPPKAKNTPNEQHPLSNDFPNATTTIESTIPSISIDSLEETDPAIDGESSATTTTTATEAQPASIDPPPQPSVEEVTKVGEADLAVHHAGTTIDPPPPPPGEETDPAKDVESSATTTTPAGPTTVTASDSPPALMHSLPPATPW